MQCSRYHHEPVVLFVPRIQTYSAMNLPWSHLKWPMATKKPLWIVMKVMTAPHFPFRPGDHRIDNNPSNRDHGEAEDHSEVKRAVRLHQPSMIMPHESLIHLAVSRPFQTWEALPQHNQDQEGLHQRLTSLVHRVLIREQWDLATRMECTHKTLD